MAGAQRQQRVQEAIREAIIEVLPTVRDPRLGFVTITGVEVSPDLGYARVFFSVYGPQEQQIASTAGIKSAKGYIRREVGRRVRLRIVPELDFRLDKTPENAESLMRLLEEIKESSVPRDPAAPSTVPSERSGS